MSDLMRPCPCCTERGRHAEGCTLQDDAPEVFDQLDREWDLIRAARAQALEEAAKLAMGYATNTGDAIAGGIRRLKERP